MVGVIGSSPISSILKSRYPPRFFALGTVVALPFGRGKSCFYFSAAERTRGCAKVLFVGRVITQGPGPAALIFCIFAGKRPENSDNWLIISD